MRFRAVLLAATLGLGACAGLPDLRVEQAALLEFELAGRIAVRYGEQAASGNVAWRHTRDSDEMLITTPVGGAVARIARDRHGVVLTTADGVEHRADSAEALTERVLGFRLPLEGLSDWVRARPAPGPTALAQYDVDARLASLEQNGWRIDYIEYAAAVSGANAVPMPAPLPTRIRLQYPALDMRLAIHDWKLP